MESKKKTKEPVVEESKPEVISEPIKLRSGICVMCNDPVTLEKAVYDHPCHRECYNGMGDASVLRRIKELSNG